MVYNILLLQPVKVVFELKGSMFDSSKIDNDDYEYDDCDYDYHVLGTVVSASRAYQDPIPSYPSLGMDGKGLIMIMKTKTSGTVSTRDETSPSLILIVLSPKVLMIDILQ